MELIHELHSRSPREFAYDVIERLKDSRGVDLASIFNNHALSRADKLRLGRTALLEAVIRDLEIQASPEDLAVANGGAEPDLAHLFGADYDIEPNMSIIPADLPTIMGYTGDQVRLYLVSLTKRFENAQNAKTAGQLAVELVAGGLISVGVPAAYGAIQAFRGGATVLAAARAGVLSVGMKTAVAAVVVILVGFLLYLILDNPKKILGMVINNTDDNLVVNKWRDGLNGGEDSDLFMQHGYMTTFPVDNEGTLDSPEVQIKGRIMFGDQDPENLVFAAIYFADRNVGFRGSEGVMIFSSRTTNFKFAHLFAVPYTNDNGVNLRVLTGQQVKAKDIFRDMYDQRAVSFDRQDQGYRLTGNANDARGGVVTAISSISQI